MDVAYGKLTDKALLDLLKSGDEMAFSEIYERFWPLLYRHARRFLKHNDEARDVVQEVFLLLWEKIPTLHIDISLNAYLFAAVRNRALNVIAHSKVKDEYIAAFERFIEEGEAIADHRLRNEEMARLIRMEIAALPPKMRRAFLLSRETELTYREIAEHLQVAENTIRKQISQAIQRLRMKLIDFTYLVLLFLP